MVGLGNPGAEFAGSLHNAGSDAVELLATRHGTSLRGEKGVAARVGVASMADRRVALAVPTTYMNESGVAVRGLARRYGITDPGAIVIVHDELDLSPGTVRLKAGGGLAGHNGLRSIESHLHTNEFLRVRIGVGKPASAAAGRQSRPEASAQSGPGAPRYCRRDGSGRGRADRGRRARCRHAVVSLPADLAVLPASPTQAPERDVTADLSAVPRRLRGDPVVATLMGARDTTLAVPEAAQAVVVAALAAFTERQPILVVTAAGLDAERLAGDLGCLLPRATPNDPGQDDVVGALHSPAVVLPAWETLPFERVSPDVETMGRRLAVLHSLIGGPAQGELPAAPRVIVAPVPRAAPASGSAPRHDPHRHPARAAGRCRGTVAAAGGEGLPP